MTLKSQKAVSANRKTYTQEFKRNIYIRQINKFIDIKTFITTLNIKKE